MWLPCPWFGFEKIVYHKWENIRSIKLADEAGLKLTRKFMIKAIKTCGCAILGKCLDSPNDDDDIDLNDSTPFHEAFLDEVLKQGWDKVLKELDSKDPHVATAAFVQLFKDNCSATCKEKAKK